VTTPIVIAGLVRQSMITDGAWLATAVIMDARNACGHEKVG
jgi:hypothetical protein